jgi:CRP/FNR family transcriptional regulator/CRP/FNR family cyclic AMP-dependent transcriptional regulator
MSRPQDVVAALRLTPYLRHVDEDVVADLAAAGKIREYKRGTYVCHEGEDAPDVYFLVAGRVEISSSASNGSRVLHATVDIPQFLGELAVLGAMPRTASVLTLDASTVWMVEGETFLRFLTAQPEASREALRALAQQVRAQEAFVDDLLFLDLKGRVAKRLLQFVTPSLEDLPADGAVAPSGVTHADLASMCGGSRENVTRVLSEFQRRGLIEKDDRRRYVLTKVSGLAKLAGL